MTTDSVDPHDAITLDQYYYVFQEDTEKRDQDQVLSRYPVNWAKAQVKERERTTGSSTPWTKKSAKETPTSPSDQILAIHQAWLFVVDDSMQYPPHLIRYTLLTQAVMWCRDDRA